MPCRRENRSACRFTAERRFRRRHFSCLSIAAQYALPQDRRGRLVYMGILQPTGCNDVQEGVW